MARKLTSKNDTLLSLCIAVGVALRLRQFLEWRSLWMDEAMLALNVVTRPFTGLFEPLEYNQGAPVGFLVLQKLATLVLGESDTALRVVPLLASCVAVVVFARMARTWNRRSAALTTALFAIAPALVEYSVEAKQYPIDVAACVLILHSVTPWVSGREISNRAWQQLAIAGLIFPWLSHPAVFVLAGSFLVVAAGSVGQGRQALARTASIAATWLASFTLLYWTSLRHLAHNPVLTTYWRESFAPLASPELLRWTHDMTIAYLDDVASLGRDPGWGILALGAASMSLRRPDLAAALILPLFLACAASGLALYPYSGRMLLFAVPPTLLLAGEAVARVSSLTGNIAARVAGPRASSLAAASITMGAALVLLVNPAMDSWHRFLEPRRPEALRPALQYMTSHIEPGEAVYVYYGAKPAVTFYARTMQLPAAALVMGRAHRLDPAAYRREIRQVLTSPGAWLVLSHNCPVCPADEWGILLAELDAHGVRVESHETTGAAVHHYRFEQRGRDSGAKVNREEPVQ